jgi:hypothetical protein
MCHSDSALPVPILLSERTGEESLSLNDKMYSWGEMFRTVSPEYVTDGVWNPALRHVHH